MYKNYIKIKSLKTVQYKHKLYTLRLYTKRKLDYSFRVSRSIALVFKRSFIDLLKSLKSVDIIMFLIFEGNSLYSAAQLS